MIPRLDAAKIAAGDVETLATLKSAAEGIGFMTVTKTAITPARMRDVLAAYRAFFALPEADKQVVNMALTGANRKWGAPLSEHVDPDANPDYKQVFDCGFELPAGDPRAGLPVRVAPGDFVINFGEMLEMWTRGRVKATLHRVVGSSQERISVPMFFNPNFDTNVAPMGSDAVIMAGEHLSKRFAETYVHMKTKG
ncbi:2-oxoglutarate and iron-dependent oxygenase domain-containing protein [Mesobacterium sp. TK19101]|uniref:2-oxoglutarate-dependent ethylene/succinate-forming enzyme n=1 Tax=Mesobacterium hydrothermale TaxID=3111907 RepID=A0ABU6HGS5_9RHOB|nr:2-oxoglutarate and iron-dependent oxygenase domain-containing protein [Mesobacterium sp. TK19101]MEC3861660.1 2-oxoglutarate and iron-dependent oxygenase domain-containing protein [Mesobacterium sp. TK19101]